VTYTEGAISTLISPRQMYVTTDAVESFVEDHYQYQIKKLRAGSTHSSSSSSSRVHDGRQTHASTHDEQRASHVSVEADAAMLTLLEHCCEEEIEHREEARERAGPARFWVLGRAADATWRRCVMLGSAAAAHAAKVV
jgi:3-demethoxyubiquinol 3-hydroxylase